ncbi:MAG: ABC transporter permease [Candidatus Eisenbacteria bacterium]|uniref:ABC transporter permease n=1 Tax=Eiseniibacteriota bacterium TaxID=2212470 RepID=A0A933SAX2_UNCEI|nr:ABC transporter permease [Candidatus Eisenbacteria bacterium]
MGFATLLEIGLQALTRNLMRSALTVLGIVIGVAAVIATLAIGQGAREAVQAQIRTLGANVMTVMPGTVTAGGARMGMGGITTMTPEDAEAITRECSAIVAVSPSVRRGAQVVYGNQNWGTTVQGVAPAYLDIRQWPVDNGAMFTDSDVRGTAKVCVLGSKVRDQLFGTEDPVGQTIRIKDMPFKVVGVLSYKGGQGMGGDQDDVVLIPWTTAQRKLLGITHLQGINVSAASQAQVTQAQDQITQLLRQRHKIREGDNDDFFIFTQLDIASTAESTSKVMTTLLASIAAVSLLVGGIGIMNIMLVSVTERTREIGIRRALGARRRDVLVQFLVEATFLSLAGGAIGAAIGVGTAKAITNIARWPTAVQPEVVLLALGFASLVGVFFGFYPAKRAADLDVIESLRYE